MRERHVLVIGPTEPPINGMARIVDSLSAFLAGREWTVRRVLTNTARPLHLTGKVRLSNILAAVRSWWNLWNELRARRPGVLYLAITQGQLGLIRDLGLLWLAARHDRPIVVHLFGGEFDRVYTRQWPPIRRLIRKLFGYVSIGIVTSEMLRRCLACVLPAECIRVVPNGVAVRPPVPEEHQRVGEPLQVLYLSVIYLPKGVLDFCEAARLTLQRSSVPLRFVVAGLSFPDAEAAVRRHLRDSGTGTHVHVLGPIEDADKQALFESTHIFVFPSQMSEAHPLVVLEAMMAGLPVVATRVGDLAATLPPAVEPHLVPPGRPDGLADAILNLVNDHNRRIREGRENRARALQQFSLDACGGRLAGILEGLLEAGRASMDG